MKHEMGEMVRQAQNSVAGRGNEVLMLVTGNTSEESEDKARQSWLQIPRRCILMVGWTGWFR